MGAIIAIVMLAGRSMAPVGQLAFLMTRGRQAITTMASIQQMIEAGDERSEEHTSELQSLMRISYAVFCLKKKTNTINETNETTNSTKCNIKTSTKVQTNDKNR